MIIVKLIGGLGNQMFQYAVGRHLAIKNDCLLKLDISGFEKYTLRTYDLHHFNIKENIATADDLSGALLPSDWFYQKMHKRMGILFGGVQKIKYVKESIRDFIPEILTLGNNVYLDGYWQSEKYFKDIEHIIRDEFIVKTPPDPINKQKSKEIQDSESVCIHIRRGDYVTNPVTNQTHGVCTVDYYLEAIEKMLKTIDNPHFYVFSDDIEWAKANISVNRPIDFLSHNNASKNYEDLRLMSDCKHHIIANSSFSWWGAWLGKKEGQIVISPGRWFTSKKEHNMDDRIPGKWLRMN